MIKAGPVETDVEATNEYARVDAKNELTIIFRKFFPNSASNSVKLICADYYPSCNYKCKQACTCIPCNLRYIRLDSKMLYVYHAHAYPNGAEVLGSLTQSCHASENSTEATVATRTSSEDCLVEDSCFIDIKLQEARTIQVAFSDS